MTTSNVIEAGDQVVLNHDSVSHYKNENGVPFKVGDIVTVEEILDDNICWRKDTVVLIKSTHNFFDPQSPHHRKNRAGIYSCHVTLHKKKAQIDAEQAALTLNAAQKPVEEAPSEPVVKEAIMSSETSKQPFNGIKVGDQIRVKSDRPRGLCMFTKDGKYSVKGDILTVAGLCNDSKHEHLYSEVALFESAGSCSGHVKMGYMHPDDIEVYKTAEQIAQEAKAAKESKPVAQEAVKPLPFKGIKVGDQIRVTKDSQEFCEHGGGKTFKNGDIITVAGLCDDKMHGHLFREVILVESTLDCIGHRKMTYLSPHDFEFHKTAEQVAQEAKAAEESKPVAQEATKPLPFGGIKVGDQIRVTMDNPLGLALAKKGEILTVAGLCNDGSHGHLYPEVVLFESTEGCTGHARMTYLFHRGFELHKTAEQVAQEAKEEVKPDPVVQESIKPLPFGGIKIGDQIRVKRNSIERNKYGECVKSGDILTVTGLCSDKTHRHSFGEVVLFDSTGRCFGHARRTYLNPGDFELHKTAEQIAQEAKAAKAAKPEPVVQEAAKPLPFKGIKVGDQIRVTKDTMEFTKDGGGKTFKNGDIITIAGLCDDPSHGHTHSEVVLFESANHCFEHIGMSYLSPHHFELHKSAEQIAQEAAKAKEEQSRRSWLTGLRQIRGKLFTRSLFERRSV